MDSAKVIIKRMLSVSESTNNKEFSDYLGVSYNTLNTWIKRDSIPMEKMSEFVQNRQLSYDWLLTGKENISLDDKTTPNRELPPSDNLVEITYYEDIVASAGGGAYNHEHSAPTLVAFDKNFLKTHLGLTTFNNIHIITSTGDSMEPTISAGELLFISPIENESSFIREGGIYIIMCEDTVLVKRVSKDNISKEITLISDNSIYPQRVIKLDDFNGCKILGRVIGHFNGL